MKASPWVLDGHIPGTPYFSFTIHEHFPGVLAFAFLPGWRFEPTN
jgi:hypothetical protein